VYGQACGALEGVPIAGILGDQQAALFGQASTRTYSKYAISVQYYSVCASKYNVLVKRLLVLCVLDEVPIAGILGDQRRASLFGQARSRIHMQYLQHLYNHEL
jgi:glycerol kinase